MGLDRLRHGVGHEYDAPQCREFGAPLIRAVRQQHQLVIDRIERRMDALEPVTDPRQAAEQFLAELLPLDDERREENVVWLASPRAMVDPDLRECSDNGYDLLRSGCHRWVVALTGADADVELETTGSSPCSTASPSTPRCGRRMPPPTGCARRWRGTRIPSPADRRPETLLRCDHRVGNLGDVLLLWM